MHQKTFHLQMHARHCFAKDIPPLSIPCYSRTLLALERRDVDAHQRADDDMYFRIRGRTFIMTTRVRACDIETTLPTRR